MFNFTKGQTSKRIISLTAIAMAATITASAISTEASAGKRERRIAIGIASAVLGIAAARNGMRPSRPSGHSSGGGRETEWERHVRRCKNAYASYDEGSDTYISHSGAERTCNK